MSNVTILPSKSIYYNDCVLVAQPAHPSFTSRKNVPDERWRIIVSPMEAIIGETFIKFAARNGISIVLHRFNSIPWQIKMVRLFENNKIHEHQKCFCSTGLDNFADDLNSFTAHGIQDAGLDIANGYLKLSKYVDEWVKTSTHIREFDNFYCGNVHTDDGCTHLAETFKLLTKTKPLIRVGIGGGSPCSTSDMTGINRGNITEIIECSKHMNHPLTPYCIIADGGINKPANACKAFAAGAGYIMLGGYFACAEEAETNVSGDGTYWGGASEKQLQRLQQSDKHSEGKVLSKKQELKPLSTLVKDLWGGITSYISYSGYLSLNDAIGNGVIEIKENSLPPKNR